MTDLSGLERLKQAAGKATPGPWTQGFSLGRTWEVWAQDGSRLVAEAGGPPPDVAPIRAERDAAFIALASPQVVAALAEAVEALEELVAYLETNTETGAPEYAHAALARVADTLGDQE